MQKSTILLVEDEPKIARVVTEYLEYEEFKVVWFQNGIEVSDYLHENEVSLVLLDVMLPDKSGFDICKDIRKFSQVPIIMVTARGHEQSRLLGFELGVDDYICKPFNPRELVSRVKAILKRVDITKIEKSKNDPAKVEHGLVINLDEYSAKFMGISVNLTPQEFRLLAVMVDRPGRVFTRDDLLELAYPKNSYLSDRAIDSHIKNLRKKLKVISGTKEVLKTIYGVGYKVDI